MTFLAGAASLTTAEDIHHAHYQHPEHSAVETAVFRYWRHGQGKQRGEMKGPMPTDLLTSPVAVAYVSHGRWVADCPFLPCRSAAYVSKADRRFFCIECDNGGTAKWVAVTWPSDADVAAIEAALGVRPMPTTRSWLVGEDVAHLLDENKAMGL